MALYNKLLLSTGGGIVSAIQQAEQERNTATVLIGLGGTGVDCLRAIKTQVYSRLKPDDERAVKAEYSHIRFLAVDTDERSRGYGNEDEDDTKNKSLTEHMSIADTEYFSIAESNVRRNFENPAGLKQKPELSWLMWEKIEPARLTEHGAGGCRQVGRYMMMIKSDIFMRRIEDEITAAKRDLNNPKVHIHIISGLSGGTGAGTFLDVCYMVRYVANRIGKASILGYFFLPDVNLSVITDGRTREYVPKNGYAAMQELDYCMKLSQNGGSFIQTYAGHNEVEWRENPVDICHLISATNSDGDIISEPYDYAMNVTAEYVMQFLTRAGSDQFDIKSYLSNYDQNISTGDETKVNGYNLAYCVLGASCAVVPLREINTYLASKFFGKLSKIGGGTPNESDVRRIAMKVFPSEPLEDDDAYDIGVLYERMSDGLKDGGVTSGYESYQGSWKDVLKYGDNDMVNHYVRQKSTRIGMLERNYSSLLEVTNEKSLQAKFSKEMEKVIKDIKRGPFFAQKIIDAAEKNNLLNIIDGLIGKNNELYYQEAAQERRKEYEEAESDFKKRRKRSALDSDKKRFEDYRWAIEVLIAHDVLIEFYKKTDAMLNEVKNFMINSNAAYFIKLKRVVETLIETFAENMKTLESEKIMKGRSSFAEHMMTIEELKSTLDQRIESVNVEGSFESLMQNMISNSKEWIDEDENKISRMVRDFFTKEIFADFAGKTINQFLEYKYDTANYEELTEKIYNEWMRKLTSKAKPRFYFNNAIWREDDCGNMSNISCPSVSEPVKAAAGKMSRVENKWKVNESALTDRIFVMGSACVLPICAYEQSSRYEREYFSSETVGRHYYEGKSEPGIKFNDWRKLFSLTPASLLQNERMSERLKILFDAGDKLYEEADSLGIFNDDNEICHPKKEVADAIRNMSDMADKMCESGISSDDVGKAGKLIEDMEKAMEIPLVKTNMFLKNDGFRDRDSTTRLRIRKDYFMSAPAYHEQVREIISEIKELRDLLKASCDKLKAGVNKKLSGENDIRIYCDALFTGVIEIAGPVITYRHTQFGITDEKVLSKRADEFRFNRIPIYQGYRSYQSLDDELKKEIRQEVDNRYNSGDTGDVIDNLKAELTVERINAWVRGADQYYEERKDIVNFIRKFKELLDDFLAGAI